MADDLTAALREPWAKWPDSPPPAICQEAADRIDALTALLREAHDALHIIDNRCEPSDADRAVAETLQARIRTALEDTDGR